MVFFHKHMIKKIELIVLMIEMVFMTIFIATETQINSY